MTTRIAVYNIEWFDELFNEDNSLNHLAESEERLESIKHVLELINADLITIIEAPNTTTTTGVQDTVRKLENFAQWAGLATSKALIGFPSAGRQEIAALYNPDKMVLAHDPGGQPGSKSNPPFDDQFFFDTDDDNIKEVYKFYRPPMEVKVQLTNGEIFYLMGVHTKSKGIFNSVDLVHLERESRRNRLKLYAECSWIRNRVDEWIEEGKRFAVMGDINDGPGMDLYEMRYGRSAVEIIMGDLFDPQNILRNYIGRPKWNRYGWEPSSARFKDRITETYVNVLIDHILASHNLPVMGDTPARVWNPYQHSDLSAHKKHFHNASDHFPVSLDLLFST
jgi:hypothetical protein